MGVVTCWNLDGHRGRHEELERVLGVSSGTGTVVEFKSLSYREIDE